jgi:MarR family 2-MHQ and catechol resistance regulon transcriptional repressor
MKKTTPDADRVHAWLVLGKAFVAMARFTTVGIQASGLGDSDFRVLEALLHKGPLPVNVIGPKVFLTPGSISTAVDRLFSKGLVSREEGPDDRRIRVVALTEKGRALILPIYRKHADDIRAVFADFTPADIRRLERLMKKAGRRAEALHASSGRPPAPGRTKG